MTTSESYLLPCDPYFSPAFGTVYGLLGLHLHPLASIFLPYKKTSQCYELHF